MPGFNGYDSIINALTVLSKGQRRMFNKASFTTANNYWSRLWNAAGHPAAGAEPASLLGSVPTKDTLGAIPFVNPTSPATLHLLQWSNFGINANGILLYDRLWHAGNISLGSGAQQVITLGSALTRYANGIEVEIAIEITTAAGTGAKTMSIEYTNTDNVTGRTATISIDASAPINRVYFATLQAGDRGVKSIESVTMTGTLNTGVANILLFMDIDSSNTISSTDVIKDLITQYPSLPNIVDNACLSFYILASTTTSGAIRGKLLFCESEN